MPLLVKDANTAVQSLSTQTDAAGALVPVHVPAAVASGIAVPASAVSIYGGTSGQGFAARRW